MSMVIIPAKAFCTCYSAETSGCQVINLPFVGAMSTQVSCRKKEGSECLNEKTCLEDMRDNFGHFFGDPTIKPIPDILLVGPQYKP